MTIGTFGIGLAMAALLACAGGCDTNTDGAKTVAAAQGLGGAIAKPMGPAEQVEVEHEILNPPPPMCEQSEAEMVATCAAGGDPACTLPSVVPETNGVPDSDAPPQFPAEGETCRKMVCNDGQLSACLGDMSGGRCILRPTSDPGVCLRYKRPR